MKKYKIDSMFYDGEVKYHIEGQNKKGKWKLLYGNMTYQEAKKDLDNPERIYNKVKGYKKMLLQIFVFYILIIILILLDI